jgi:hypothetical protein
VNQWVEGHQADQCNTDATIDTVYQWVEGHQADRHANQQLDKYSLVNHEMDKLANQYREETKHMNLQTSQPVPGRNKAHEPVTTTDYFSQEWGIWIAEQKITGDTLNTVRQHIQETEMSKWLAAPRKNGR